VIPASVVEQTPLDELITRARNEIAALTGLPLSAAADGSRGR
jgi:hypothetical protein